MKTGSAAKKASAGRECVRPGRPPKELAGEVEARILDAALKVFLERGFEGASVEEIAETARAGKPTIYARFPNKQALFAAAFMRHIIAKHTRLQSYEPRGKTIEERLANIGATIIQEALSAESIGLLRSAIAEARDFPDLGGRICREARDRGAETLARLLAEATDCGAASPSSDRHMTAARYFLDLILLPLMMRALSGENLESLNAEIGPHVQQRVAFFLTACRNGGLG